MPKRIFSAVQPTGNLHLGNYLGAIRHWLKLQDDGECLFSIVDYHAITVPQDPKELKENTLELAATYIASGIDPNKSTLFVQSHVPEHTELAWLLGCHTPMGWLNRMTQFKDKAGKKREHAPLGLYAYPVLMAADILLYNADIVPVGDDQKQHLELARDIAGAFNRHYSTDFFTIPEPQIIKQTARIMSLRDGTKKMSKSDESELSRIHLTDDADAIAAKIRKAKTDSIIGISYDAEERPALANLLNIMSGISNKSIEALVAELDGKSAAEFKQILTELLVEYLKPIGSHINKLLDDKSELTKILKSGSENAREIASKNIAEIRSIIGFL